MIINNIQEVIGNTPLFLIPEKIHGIKGLELYAKCEFLNPFGSVKDRTAMGLLREAKNYEYIIESSSGNTAKALGVLASVQGKKLLDVSNKIHLQEVEDIIKIVGTEIKSLPAGSECPDPTNPNSPLKAINRIMSENPGKYYYTDQFSNTGNPKIHEETTAKEIDDDIGTPDFFFAGLGTTGSSKGIRDYFASRGNMQSIGIITAGRSYLPGIRNSQEMFEVGLFDPKLYADFSEVDEQNAIDYMLVLIRKCGLLVGPTSGATFFGALQYFKKQNPEDLIGKKAVFIACDRLESYTGYLREKRKSLFEEENLEKIPENSEKIAVQTIENIEENSGEILVDMRSYVSYDLGHIKGSLNFPFEDLRKYLASDYLPFPKESKIIFICPFGEESGILAEMATRLGYNASSLAGGFLEFREKFPEKIV